MTGGTASSIQTFPLISTGPIPDIVLAHLVRRFAIASSFEEIARAATPAARVLMDAEGVTFVIRGDDESCHYAEEDAIAPLWKGRTFPMDACISGWCMREATPAVIPDIYQDRRIPQDAYRPTFVRSLAMVPVPEERPIAAMGAYWSTPGTASKEAVAMLRAIGNAAGLAMESIGLGEDREEPRGCESGSSDRATNVFAAASGLEERTTDENGGDRNAPAERMQALGNFHETLVNSRAGRVDLADLFESVLRPFAHNDRARFDLAGPALALSPDMATELSIVACELGADAMECGAWSDPGGMVEVRWTRNGETLQLSWREIGGPRTGQPDMTGFGTRLLWDTVRNSLNGELELHTGPDGPRCELRLPTKH